MFGGHSSEGGERSSLRKREDEVAADNSVPEKEKLHLGKKRDLPSGDESDPCFMTTIMSGVASLLPFLPIFTLSIPTEMS